MAGGLTIGTFALPPLGSGPATRIRRLVGPPTRWGPDDENLLWTEVDDAGEAQMMMWTPASAEEAKAIEEFYRAASQVDWEGVVVADVPRAGDDGPDERGGPKPRRFESRGGPVKFWEIAREGTSYTVTSGRIGTKGQSRTKSLAGEDEAREAVAALIAMKLAKGYVEVGEIPSVAGSDWGRPEAWQRVYEAIEVRPPRWGKPAPRPTEAEMDAFEAAHGFPLPPSYRAFLRVFGPGDVNSMFKIAAPGGPDYYNLERMQEEAREGIEAAEYDFVSDEYVGLEPITRMIIFCEWDSDRWGWDPAERADAGRGEYAIRHWGRSSRAAEVAAASFPEFVIDKLMRGGLGWFDDPGDPGFDPAIVRKAKPSEPRAATPKAEEVSAGARPRRRSAKEENQYLHRIAADPADEPARLAYAEWLDRYRDPLGELIRVRLERSKLHGSDPRLATLARREEGLKARVAKKKGGPLAALGLLPWALKRLGARVGLDGDGEVRHISIREYQVNAGSLREFAGYPALRELELNGHPLTPGELEALGRAATVRELHLHDVALDDDGFEPLGRLADLEYLCLLNPHSQGPGLSHLKGLPKLGLLSLHGVEGSRVAAHLAALESWPALRKLFLRGNDLRGEALAGLGRLHRIESLGLDDNPIRDGDLAHLAQLERLKWLDLEKTEITGAGLKHLRGLRSLEVLKTRAMPDADAAAPWLARLTNLRELELGGTHEKESLTDAGAAHLAGLTRLTRLILRWQRLTDAGLAYLAGLAALEELDLSDNPGIVGPGLEHLKHLPKLRRLNLNSTGITIASVPLLKAFARLEELSLFGTKIPERGLNTLRRALPHTRI
jgi:uncharacterized protein (TIGR02996 family)